MRNHELHAVKFSVDGKDKADLIVGFALAAHEHGWPNGEVYEKVAGALSGKKSTAAVAGYLRAYCV